MAHLAIVPNILKQPASVVRHQYSYEAEFVTITLPRSRRPPKFSSQTSLLWLSIMSVDLDCDEQLADLTQSARDRIEAFAIGDEDIRASALQATKFLYDQGLSTEWH